jgi:hypothetical protein
MHVPVAPVGVDLRGGQMIAHDALLPKAVTD